MATTARGGARIRGWVIGVALTTLTVPCSADEVAPDAKGIIGGTLLGAEAVLIAEALLGVEPWWAYLLGGVAGGAGGATLGYFAEETGSGELAVGMLTAGMALAIPAAIAVVAGTKYRPPDAPREDGARAHESQQARALPPLEQSGALVAIEGRRVVLTVPAVQVRELYTRSQVAIFGAKQGTHVDVPVLNVRF